MQVNAEQVVACDRTEAANQAGDLVRTAAGQLSQAYWLMAHFISRGGEMPPNATRSPAKKARTAEFVRLFQIGHVGGVLEDAVASR